MISSVQIYAIASLGVIAALLAAWMFGHHAGASRVQEKFDAYQAEVRAAGEKQRADSLQREKDNAKQIGEANTARDVALASLRQYQTADARRRAVPLVPAAPAGRSEQCFDAKALTSAVEQYRAGVFRLVAEGERASIDARALIQAWPK